MFLPACDLKSDSVSVTIVECYDLIVEKFKAAKIWRDQGTTR